MGTLLLVVTAVCALMAAARAAGAVGGPLLLLLVLAILAHVAGNALGTRLRSIGSVPEPPPDRCPDGLPSSRPIRATQFAPVTSLRERTRMGAGMIVLTLLGAVLGAACGGALLTLVNWERVTWASAALGSSSFGVLGGLAGFLGSRFLQILAHAWLQAHRGPQHR